ncbi:ParB/RepB/Spo0J family partition protein [Sinorhizobium fredii]|uniref:ParB/RepB/Spo0J family partition protein n=1 Tax=Rhizobium fredii TaxID=380 RepID=UPI0005956B0F|nr:ParB/RepB/Spo0J family partition protein [Sinorhizobium fredii]WOS62041.1 ParB/RepB/Spo0J family partition protein [Sinorhizobium fredii GR64]
MTIHTVPLQSIQPPQHNPRRSFDAAQIAGLAASIREDGLLQNLVVARSKGQQYRVISGERRYRALKLLEQRGDIAGDFAVTVEVRSKLGKHDALRLATVENVQRENLPPLDEAAAFAALIRKGSSLDDLCAKTGLSSTTIRRRLALNGLCKEAKAALAEGGISLSQAEALTLGAHAAQQSIIEEIGRGYAEFSSATIKEHFLDERPNVAMAIFPVEEYTGTITTDLFAEGETSYFDDGELFLELQARAVEKLAREYEGKAAWVEVTNAHRLPHWQYEEAEEGQESGIVINLSSCGRVEIREGLAKPEIDDDTKDRTADNPAAPPRKRETYSTPLRRLIAWHKSAAVQELLLANPRKAKEVAVIERLGNIRLHESLKQLSRQDEPGGSYSAIAEQARLVAGWLGIGLQDDEADDPWEQYPMARLDAHRLYEAVAALSDHQLEQTHTLFAALSFGQAECEYLDARDSLFNRVARDVGADMRQQWRVNRCFLEKRSRDQLAVIAVECGYAQSTGAVRMYKKGELINALLRHFASAHAAADPTPAHRKAREWLPEAMLFPAIDPDRVNEPDEDEQDMDEMADAEE